MNPTTYLIYNEKTGQWGTEPHTLEEARSLTGVTLDTYLSTTDGARQLTIAQAIREEQAAPAPTPTADSEPVYNAETNKWEYKETATSAFKKMKSVASGIITATNEAGKEEAAEREVRGEPVRSLSGVSQETAARTNTPSSAPTMVNPATLRTVPTENTPPAARAIPSSADRENERLLTFRLVRYTCRLFICLIILGTFSGGIVSLLAITRSGGTAVALATILTAVLFGLLHLGLNRYDEYVRGDDSES